MKTSTIIIAIIVVIIVVVVGAYAAITMTSSPSTTNNTTQITANGSKVTIINNNKDVWAHWKLQIQNAPQKNGTQQTYFVDAYIKPGENATFDLSSMLGYNSSLTQDTNLTVLGWGGLYNQTANGTSKFNTTFVGWTTNQTIPSPPETYKNATNPYDVDPVQNIGVLPNNITSTTVKIGTSDPGTASSDLLFTQFNIIIGPSGVPYFGNKTTPVLCNVIAGT